MNEISDDKIIPNKTLAIKLPFNFDVEDKKNFEKKVLEIIPNSIKKDEAIIVRVSKFFGFSEKTFVVLHSGKKIEITPLE